MRMNKIYRRLLIFFSGCKERGKVNVDKSKSIVFVKRKSEIILIGYTGYICTTL